MYRSLLIGISLAGLALAVATPAHADDWSKKYSVSGKPELRVETDDGDVQISTGAANEISAHVSTSGYKIGPNDVHIIESQDGNHIQLLVKGPHHMFTFNMGHHSISVQLQVPAQTDLDIHTGDGNVSSSAISGRVQVDTGDGNINSNGLHGDIHLHTGDGNVDGTDFDGNLIVDTGDGHVTVTGRFDSLSLKSGDGRIDLKLPDGFNADLDAHTGDGHISLDFPVMVSGSLSESRVRGKMNGGGGTLELTSGDGSIRIEKL